ncbi:MAG: NUDIX hydrolase [Methylobacterium sp.]|uniref:NUDIX hydrolase n=1 Tax=Methylobacterium sp. TaxID=409 RepID=UPI0026012872|nr:NUDIX hydrolase [Methylobacterium sp.]MBX9932219.1 NUDIX hydrolase [Methylobacterium sp.]
MSDGFRIASLTRIEARRVPFDWQWARDEAAYISGNWARRVEGRTGIFDGRVLLACGWRHQDGTCKVDLFETSYSRFIAYRDAGSPDPAVRNTFAAIVPRSTDGAYFLGIMGAQTANAGQAYFPCGTPDLDDIVGSDLVDLAGSAERELTEETGLAVPAGSAQEWVMLEGDRQLAFLRPIVFGEESGSLLARMERHRAAEANPELAGFLIVRDQVDIDPKRMPPFVRAYLGRSFAGAPPDQG